METEEKISKPHVVENLYDRLSEPFPVEMERTVRKSGTELVYLPVSEIINRMNRIFTPTGWSHQVISCGRDESDPEWVVAHVRVSTSVGASHDGFGGVRVKRTKQGDIVDLGDEFKGAVSDALKKACQHFGVGLYLARDIDAIEIDDAMHAPTQPNQTAQPNLLDKYNKFRELRDQLSSEQRDELRAWWNKYSGNQPVPNINQFTSEQLDDLIIAVTGLLMNATSVDNEASSSNEGE